MAKKILLTIVYAIVFFLVLTTSGLAKSDNTTTSLGNEVTGSMNKTERSMDDLVDDTNIDEVGRNIKNGARDLGNSINNGMDDMGRAAKDLVGDDNDDNMRTDERTDNRAVAGTTGNYTASQIQTDDTTGRNGMTRKCLDLDCYGSCCFNNNCSSMVLCSSAKIIKC